MHIMIKGGHKREKETDENFPGSWSKLKKTATGKQHSTVSRSKNVPHLKSGLRPTADLSIEDNQVTFP